MEMANAMTPTPRGEDGPPPPPTTTMVAPRGDGGSRGPPPGEGGSSSGSESESDSEASGAPAPPAGRQLPDRASLAASLPRGVDIDGLSDYELLRLKNIQRNQAKLASLGLGGGITSRSGSGKKTRSPAAAKAAETRRRNQARAREAVREHARRGGGGSEPRMDDAGGGGGDKAPRSREEAWRSRHAELQQCRAANGHFDLRGKHHASLRKWLYNQKKKYDAWERGEPNALTEERAKLLEGLGDGWRGNGRGTMGGTMSSSRRGLLGRNADVARRLWASESESDEDAADAERMRRDVEDEVTTDDEVDIGTEDSYSVESRDARGRRSGEVEDKVDIGTSDSYSIEESDEKNRPFDPGPSGLRDTMGIDLATVRGKRMRSFSNRKANPPAVVRRRRRGAPSRASSLERIDDGPAPAPLSKNEGGRSVKRKQNRGRRPTSYPDEESISLGGVDKDVTPLTENRSGKRKRKRRYPRNSPSRSRDGSPRSVTHRGVRGAKRRRARGAPREGSSGSYDDASVMLATLPDDPGGARESSEESSALPRRRGRGQPPSSLSGDGESLTSAGSNGDDGRPRRRRERGRAVSAPRRNRRRRGERPGRSSAPPPSDGARPAKPVEEIVVAPPRSVALAATSAERRRERDRLMAEYGRLYGRRCAIFQRRAQLECELRAILPIIGDDELAQLGIGCQSVVK